MEHYKQTLQGRISYTAPRFRKTDNYLSGTGKSHVWPAGPGWYVPSERRFISYHDHRSLPGTRRSEPTDGNYITLPNDRRADQREFQSEDSWREWQGKRDAAREYPRTESIVRMGEHNRGLAMSGLPPLKLDGYCTNPFNLHRTGVQARTLYNAKPDVRDPTWRGPHGYYGYYHERLDARDPHGFRLYKQTYNDEDWLKWEQMKTAATRT